MVPADATVPTHIIPGGKTLYLFNSVTGVKAPRKLKAIGDSSSRLPSCSSRAQVLEKQATLSLPSPGAHKKS